MREIKTDLKRQSSAFGYTVFQSSALGEHHYHPEKPESFTEEK